MVRSAIFANKAGTVKAKDNRKVLQRHIVYQLVIGTLQEGRIYIAVHHHPLGCHTGRKGYSMLFGNAHIKRTVRKSIHHKLHGAA
jgi:hypothetical protein